MRLQIDLYKESSNTIKLAKVEDLQPTGCGFKLWRQTLDVM